MGVIDDELQDVSKLCERTIPGCRLISCVESLVRVEISRTNTKKIVVCIQFPPKYPQEILLIELKSRTLSEHLLEKLTSVCEQDLKKRVGKLQILHLLKFIRSFIDENPLSCCYDEISTIKQKVLDPKVEGDELRLKQKSSSLILKVCQGNYFLKTNVIVPEDYPEKAVILQDVDTNFPPMFQRFCIGQAKEIARKCVEPPLNKKKINEPFLPKPSVLPVLSFLGNLVKEMPKENCQLCKNMCLPLNPQEAETDENCDMHVERVYCGHLFHQHCLLTYMKTPPFQGGKQCPACGKRIYHDKWRLSEKLAEDRWAHQQARERELEEVVDFFNEL
ncbi:uncharacterized protein LOC117648671 [Thrips palmi]|uniref:Uncharacterized protein LOC117648671 n=1 Tax=Thrips palmi TaxID=161013 RepID=A0A6P8ZD75_THRPL|nr:uncharacterized protein LOC117648671 [Thrips palmi]